MKSNIRKSKPAFLVTVIHLFQLLFSNNRVTRATLDSHQVHYRVEDAMQRRYLALLQILP